MNTSRPEPNREVAVAFDVAPLGRRRRRVDPGLVVVALAGVLVVAALVRPWDPGHSAPLAASAASPTASGLAALPSSSGSTLPSPSGSASPGDANPADQTRLALVIHDLADYSGSWGVGAGARSGAVDLPAILPPWAWISPLGSWSAWVGVQPSMARTSPTASTDLAGLKATELCTGLPGLPAGAQVVAITAPAGPLADFHVAGWRDAGWRDDPSGITPVPGLRQITPYATGDITYLQLADGQAWPDGRYEFQIGGAATATTLTVCLGRP